MSGSSGSTGSSGGRPGTGNIPASIGRYEIKRKLGSGAQGVVYLAYAPNLQIDVAIKVLHPEHRTEDKTRRLRDEGQIMLRLGFETLNVVRVLDLDSSVDNPMIIMEYCEGGDLNEFIKSRRQHPIRKILEITRQVLEALRVAHESPRPIIHRDVKPQNVLFSRGIAKVADLGLATVVGNASGMTSTRDLLGTPRYMSPEQVDSSKVDARSDLWSVGVMLFEMLAWIRPFDRPGDTVWTIIRRIKEEPPAPFPYELPPSVSRFLERLLEKDRDRRFASAREAISAHDEVLRSLPESDPILVPPEEMVDTLSQLIGQFRDHMEHGQWPDAGSVLKRISFFDPNDSLVDFWKKEFRKRAPRVDPRIADATIALECQRFDEARRLLYGILADDPDEADAKSLLVAVSGQEELFLSNLAEVRQHAKTARTARDWNGLVEAWRGFVSKYPKFKEGCDELSRAEEQMAWERLDGEIARLEAAGELDAAVSAIDQHVRVHPGDSKASQRRAGLVQQKSKRDRAARLVELTSEAEGLRKRGDTDSERKAWNLIGTEFPEHQSWKQQIARIDEERAEQAKSLQAARDERERTAALAEWDDRSRQTRGLLESGRYSAIGAAESDLSRALARSSEISRGSAGGIRAATEALAALVERSEEALAVAVRDARVRLLSRLDGDVQSLGEERAASEGRLRIAIDGAIVALCRSASDDAKGDPLLPLSQANAALREASSALVAERDQSISVSRKAADSALTKAKRVVRTFEDDAGPQPELQKRLDVLVKRAASQLPKELDQVRIDAAVLEAETSSARALVRAELTTRFRHSLLRAAEIASREPTGKLLEHVVTARSHFDPSTGSSRGGAAKLRAAVEELEAELAHAGKAQKDAVVRAEAAWADALRLAEGINADGATELDSLVAAGNDAKRDLRALDLERLAKRVERAAVGRKLMDAWARHAALVKQAEQTPSTDAATKALIRRFRQALASGDADEMGVAAETLARASRESSGSKEQPGDKRMSVGRLSGRLRRANARWNPRRLEEFDSAVRRLDTMRSGKRSGAGDVVGELERARRRLILHKPLPWKGIAAAAVVTVAFAGAAAKFWPTSDATGPGDNPLPRIDAKACDEELKRLFESP